MTCREGTLLDRTAARAYARRLAESGMRLVLTNGCFDVLHAGHVCFLESARALGDALLVGLNSDLGTRALKGPSRPIVPQDDRVTVLLALRSVDAVVLFDEPTAGPLLRELQPPIYVKGGDYSITAGDGRTLLPEEPDVRSYGGSIVLLPYLPGHSTSRLIARIRGES